MIQNGYPLRAGLDYPNGINGLPRPSIEFEAKFLVEINNLYEGWCCDKAMLFPGADNAELANQIKKWMVNGSINASEYFSWIEKWCEQEGTACYGKASLIDKKLPPSLLQKFIKEKSSCLN